MTITLDSIELNYETYWIDEFNFSDVKSTIKYTLGGRLIENQSKIESSVGRPITLGGDNSWITRENLLTLYEWLNDSLKRMTLTLHDNRTFQVGFRYWDMPVITTNPIFEIANPDNDTEYILTALNLAIM